MSAAICNDRNILYILALCGGGGGVFSRGMAHILNACIVLVPCGGGGGGHFCLGIHVVAVIL